MIQCKDCELYEQGPDGSGVFHCNPFTNVKEAECLANWQFIKLDISANLGGDNEFVGLSEVQFQGTLSP